MEYICVYGAVNDEIEYKYNQAGFELGQRIAYSNRDKQRKD